MTFVRRRVHGPVAELQLDRAEALNAMTPEMMDAIAGELETIDADPALRVAVIAGDDRAFVAVRTSDCWQSGRSTRSLPRPG
jgi:enoyl-CoA hydratase/carnithine racemase